MQLPRPEILRVVMSNSSLSCRPSRSLSSDRVIAVSVRVISRPTDSWETAPCSGPSTLGLEPGSAFGLPRLKSRTYSYRSHGPLFVRDAVRITRSGGVDVESLSLYSYTLRTGTIARIGVYMVGGCLRHRPTPLISFCGSTILAYVVGQRRSAYVALRVVLLRPGCPYRQDDSCGAAELPRYEQLRHSLIYLEGAGGWGNSIARERKRPVSA